MLSLCLSCVQLPTRGCHAAPQSCKHRVHVACTVQVPYRVEVIFKVCAPKPRLSTATNEKAGQAPVESPMEGGLPLAAFRKRCHVMPRL